MSTDGRNTHEFALICLIVENPTHMDRVALELTPEDFGHPLMRRVYAEILKVYQQGHPIGKTEGLVSFSYLNTAEDREVLYALIDAGGQYFTHSLDFYLEQIKKQNWRQKARAAIEGIRTDLDGARSSEQIDDAKLKIEHSIDFLMKQAPAIDRVPFAAPDAANEALEALDSRMTRRSVISTGLKGLDGAIGGWQPARYVITAAGTGGGKTLIATNFCLEALKQGKRVLYCTIEMERAEIIDRLVCAHMGLETLKVSSGRLSEREKDLVFQGYGEIARMPLHVAHLSSGSLEELEMHVTRMTKQHALDLLIVDYIQDLRVESGNFKSRYELVTEVTKRIRNLTKVTKVATIGLAQLSREGQKNPDARPTKYQIRDSGQIEQDSDVTLIAHTIFDEMDGVKHPRESYLYVDKNRHGPLVALPVKIDFARNKLSDMKAG
jgi:replicative DNA helicase